MASGAGRPRLAGEPDDNPATTATSLGTLAVPVQNGPAITTRRDGFLTEPSSVGSPVSLGEIALFDRDVDRYRFALADFADVEISNLPAPLLLAAESWNPWHASGSLPPTLKVQLASGQTQDLNTTDVVGFAGARLRVCRLGDPCIIQVRSTRIGFSRAVAQSVFVAVGDQRL
mgnify:CR=1 FL=1